MTRLEYKSKKLQNGIYLFLISGLMIPIYILLFPIYRINIELNLVGSYISVILPLAASSISFNILMFAGFMKGFPSDLEEAAIIDGCSLPRLCLKVTLPLLKPVLTTVAVFNLLYVWNEFPLEVTLIQDPAMRTISMGSIHVSGTVQHRLWRTGGWDINNFDTPACFLRYFPEKTWWKGLQQAL